MISRRTEGLLLTQLRNLGVALLFCYIIIFSASSVYAPQTLDNSATSTDLPSITSQYSEIGALSFESDGEFQTWAGVNALVGDGSQERPYYFTRLIITAVSEPSLRLSNIRDTWFTFDDCVFVIHQQFSALELVNATKGHFTNCFIYGAVLHNHSDFNVIMHSYISGEVYVEDSLHTVFYHNSFDDEASVFVGSLSRISTNVSFYDNNFLSDLALLDCTECYVVYNRFFSLVRDNGYANNWDGNSYADYSGLGPYLILGSAGSIDSNPAALETSTIIMPEPITTSTTGTRTTTTTNTLAENPYDDVLLGIIGFEIVLVILILEIRKRSGQ